MEFGEERVKKIRPRIPDAALTFAVAALIAGVALGFGSPKAAPATATQEAEWPCVQRYVPELSAGTIWTGTPPDELATPWYDDERARNLVYDLSAETLEMEEGVAMIDDFAATLGPDRNGVLTQVFAGLFDNLNTQRRRILNGIKNFFRRQQTLVKKINSLESEIRELEKAGVAKDDEPRKDLETQLIWSVRVYDERLKLTVYVCEEPILLEQRLGAYARAIAAHLEE